MPAAHHSQDGGTPRNVLITGGAGFLGARLAKRLLARGSLRGAGGSEEELTRLTLLDVAPARGITD